MTKSTAHTHFDYLWKSGHFTREEAYAWLAKQMRMSTHDCHMRSMSDEELEKVVEICRTKKAELRYLRKFGGSNGRQVGSRGNADNHLC